MRKNNKKDEFKRKILTAILILALAIVLIAVVVNPAQGLSMEALQNYTIEEEQTLTFNIVTTENNGTVIFSKAPTQGTLTKIDDTLAIFEWTPNTGENGTYNFVFTATDDFDSISKNNKIIVIKKNIPPIINDIIVGPQNTAQVQMDLNTNTAATCKYSLSDKTYAQMEYTFAQTNSEKTGHGGKTPSLSQGSHTIYILCTDLMGNYMTTSSKINLNINLRPSATIVLDPSPPLKEGTIKVELSVSEDLISVPVLKYSFDDESTLRTVALTGSGKFWEGYLIIKDTNSERVGSFIFEGMDMTNQEGTDITRGKIFLVDTLNPEAIQSISVENQNDRVKLTWNEPSSENVKQYKIYRKTTTGGVEEVDQYSTTTDTTFYDRDVEYNEAYYYRVSVVDDAGNEGALSKEVFLTHIPIIIEKNTELIEPADNIPDKTLDPKLEYILETELQKVDKILMDINKAEETISRSLGSDNIDAIEGTKALITIRDSKSKINEIRTRMNNLRNTDIEESNFNTATKDMISQIETIWKNTPIEIKVLDSATYAEFTDDEKTTSIILSYLTEYYSSLSQKELTRTVEDAKIFQDKLIINVKIIKGEIKYPEETKPFSMVKKTFSSEESLQKILLFEYIPENVKEISSIEFSEQPFYRKNYAFWKLDSINDKSIYYTLYSEHNLADLKSVKSIIFDESALLAESNDLITGQVVKDTDTEAGGGILLSLIIAGVLVICGLFAYYIFWSETDGEEKVKETEQKQNHKKFDVSATLFKKKKETILPDDIQKKIEIEKPEESIHNHSDSVEFKRVISTDNQKYTPSLESSPNQEIITPTKKNYEELNELQQKLELLKKTSKVEDLDEFDELRSKTYEIKKLCEEIEEQSIIDFSNKTRAHLEKSLLYIAKNVPPERKQVVAKDNKAESKEHELEHKEKEKTPEEKQRILEKNAPEWNEFILTNGERIKNITSLKEKLKEMPDETFSNYVSEEKNDFASWIRDVFQEYELAHKVRTAKTRDELINIL